MFLSQSRHFLTEVFFSVSWIDECLVRRERYCGEERVDHYLYERHLKVDWKERLAGFVGWRRRVAKYLQ